MVKKLRHLTDNYDQIVKTKQIQKLTNSAVSRFKVSDDIRAFFIAFYEKQDGTIVVLDVTSRENAYTKKSITELNKQANEELYKRKPKFPKK